MYNDTPRSGKAKIIAWCVAIAAVAIIYIFVTNQSHPGTTAFAPSSNTVATAPVTSSTSSGNSSSGSMGSGSMGGGMMNYKDGNYTASGSYRTPSSIESIQVNLTVSGGTITQANVQQEPTNPTSAAYQEAFQQGYKPYVVGKKLSDISLSRVSGSSLTSIGFDQALEQIKSQAQQG